MQLKKPIKQLSNITLHYDIISLCLNSNLGQNTENWFKRIGIAFSKHFFLNPEFEKIYIELQKSD